MAVESWANRFYASANEAWEGLYEGLCEEGEIVSPRGKKVKETLGCNIYIENPNNNLVTNTYRGLSPIYMAREFKWYNEGSRDPQVAPNSKFWKSIANADNTINSNYGHWLFAESDNKNLDMSVFDATIRMLQDDPDTRHAIIQIPIMPYRRFKDTPCTSHIHFFVRNNKLFANVYMRSCDVCCGFPYDIFQFTMWQLRIAKELGIECGWIRFMAGSLHCYEEDWIENREDNLNLFQDSKNSEYDGLRRISDDFLEDLDNLNNYRKDFNPDVLHSQELRFMFDNRKIWKRENW